ncbi:alpha-tocopherol transfer protein-like [Daktulosphaira vitifoliae]|uniref:alpha-tocopherol transfer protein-like n=1 Tax=Daktulosphaira vitifoliae TaxID=58002 RepID=UPI0021AAC2D9|nr:alpha-tocopherol transfer protein-like [Daktulosphaira vitifoliae]
MYNLSTSFDEYLRGEQKKYPQLKVQDIQLLRKSLEKEKQIPFISEKKLIAFLHSCYFDVEMARITAIECYKCYFEVPQLFCNLDPRADDVLLNYDCTSLGDLTYNLKSKNDRYLYWQFKDTNPEMLNYMAIFKVLYMWMERTLLTEGTFDGVIIIINTAGLSWRHILKLPIGAVSKLLKFLQEGLPLRLKMVHVLNTGPSVTMLLNIISPFIGKELMSKIMFHASGSINVFDHIPKNLLPFEVSGSGKSHNFYNDCFYEFITEYREWFLEQNCELKKYAVARN